MIVLFTDFGLEGPYIGQMSAVLHREAPDARVVNLFADAPRFRPRSAAYLLAAYATEFPAGTLFLCVVDPGVGTTSREPVIVEADGRYFVGPGNGLFNVVGQRAERTRCWTIEWRPERLSATFHGRDLFAPVTARLARGEWPTCREKSDWLESWPADLAEVIYIDGFGNAMTGLRAAGITPASIIEVEGIHLRHGRTFGEVPPGSPFWYENANGLVEIAVNGGSAAARLGLRPGDPLTLIQP